MTDVPDRAAQHLPGGPGVTRFVMRGPHRLSYESSGAASGIPVLALHDLLADRGQFRPLAEMLRPSGFRLTLPDARGHGASAMIAGRNYPVREMAADALVVLDAENVPAAHVAAVGWGVATALAMAAVAPERISSLVLAEPQVPGPGARSSGESPETARGQADLLREAASAADKGRAEHALDLYLGLRFGARWRDDLPKSRLGAIRRAAGSLAPLLSGLAGDGVDQDALARLEAPVTLLLHPGAPSAERGTIETLASLLPQARVETVSVPLGTASAPEAWIEAFASALRAPAPTARS